MNYLKIAACMAACVNFAFSWPELVCFDRVQDYIRLSEMNSSDLDEDPESQNGTPSEMDLSDVDEDQESQNGTPSEMNWSDSDEDQESQNGTPSGMGWNKSTGWQWRQGMEITEFTNLYFDSSFGGGDESQENESTICSGGQSKESIFKALNG